MSYSYPFSRDVVYSFRDSYPRGCMILRILSGRSTRDINEYLIKCFQSHQLRWRSMKALIKMLDDYHYQDIKKLSKAEGKQMLSKLLQYADDFALDSFENE